MLTYNYISPSRVEQDTKFLPANAGSQAQLTKWGAVLCRVGEKNIPPGSTVVDLGAGPQAVIMEQIIKSGVQANWIAVEPNFSVKAPSGSTIVRGDLRAFSKNSLDVILFNPPVLPSRFLNSSSPHYYMFLGGTDWTNILEEVIKESQRCLCRGGRLIIVCPTFLQPSLLNHENLFIQEYCYESFDSFVSRAPLRDEQTAKELIFNIQERSDASAQKWRNLGISNLPDHFAVVALGIRYS